MTQNNGQLPVVESIMLPSKAVAILTEFQQEKREKTDINVINHALALKMLNLLEILLV
jgi:hypothetical protein